MANSPANTELSASDAERFRAYERRRHDALAQGYDNFFTPVTKLAIGPLLKAVQPRAGMRVLDVATGTGALAAAAEKQGAKAVGTDLSPGMVALAAAHYPGIEFREADVERLPFPTHRSTLSFAISALAISRIPSALRRNARAC